MIHPMYRRLPLLSLSLLILAGCAFTGARFAPVTELPNNTGVIYVYRPSRFENSAISPGIILDGVEQPKLPSGRYLPLTVPAGVHRVELQLSERYSGASSVEIAVAPGGSYYVLLETRNEDAGRRMMRRVFKLSLKPSEAAQPVLRRCNLQDPVHGEHFKRSDRWVDN